MLFYICCILNIRDFVLYMKGILTEIIRNKIMESYIYISTPIVDIVFIQHFRLLLFYFILLLCRMNYSIVKLAYNKVPWTGNFASL